MPIEEPAPRSRRRPLGPGLVIAATAAAIVAIIAARFARERGTRMAMNMHIDRPVADVFAVVSDTRNDLQWMEAAVERRKVTAGPIGVGTRFESTDRFGPRTIGMTEEIIEFEQDRSVKVRVSGSWDGIYEIDVESDDGGTLLSVDMTAHGNGIVALLDLVPDAVVRSQFERDAARLKELLERQGERPSTADEKTAADAPSAKRRVSVAIEPEAESTIPVTEETAAT